MPQDNPVLQYFREKDPFFKSVDDSTLTAYIRERFPEFSKYLDATPQTQLPLEGGSRRGEIERRFSAPFQTAARRVAPNNPRAQAAARVLDIPMESVFMPIARGVEKIAQATTAPNTGTGVLEGMQGAIQSAVPVAFPVGSAAFGAGMSALPQSLQELISGITNPITSVSNPQTREAQAVAGLADAALQFAAFGGGKKAVEKAPEYGAGLRQRAAQRIGGYLGAGESIPKMQRAGEFVAEFDISPGLSQKRNLLSIERADQITRSLNKQLNEKIIDPATKAGRLIPTQNVVAALEKQREVLANALPPDRAAVKAIDRLIEDAKANLEKSEFPGYLTPRQAQDLKVLNNKVLADHYARIERAGQALSPIANVKKQGMATVTDVLRKGLEELDPQVKGINWTEGAGLEVKRALENFYEARLKKDPSLIRGSGMTGAAAGRPRIFGLFVFTELFGYRPFLIAWNKLQYRLGSALSGTKAEFVKPDAVKVYKH